MNPIDFVSRSPSFYIFKKKSNKTNFGGILTLIYGIVMIGICIYYVFEFKNTYLRDSYTIQSFTRFNKKIIEKKDEAGEDNFSQNINFRIRYDYTDFILLDKLVIYKRGLHEKVPTSFSYSTDYFPVLYIGYKCDEANCPDFYQNLDRFEQNFTFSLLYDGFTLDHQNNDKPIQKGGNFAMEYTINLNKVTTISNIWKQIIYKEKKGYFHQDYVDFGFYIDDYKKIEQQNLEHFIFTDDEHNNVLVFCYFSIENNNNNIVEYTRTKKSTLDLLANVFSLFSNIYFIMSFIFQFYSKNYDNFQIIETIISHKLEKKPLTSLQDLESEKINNPGKDFPILKDFDESADKGKNNIDILENNEDGDKINESDFRLKNVGFCQFYINNLYSNFCCKNNKAQNIINLCNQIVNKYASMDTIIYNQILLENLFKDYKWNNIELSDLRNNDLIEKLKVLQSLES